MPEFNAVIQVIQLLCSLIVKLGLNDSLLYIIIELSHDPDSNLPSFNFVKQYILFVWCFNLWIGSLSLILKSLYKSLFKNISSNSNLNIVSSPNNQEI